MNRSSVRPANLIAATVAEQISDDSLHVMDDSRYHTKRWQQLRALVIRRDGHTCAIPGCQTDMTEARSVHADHIIDVRSDGGDFWALDNIQTLCGTHHRAKTLDSKAKRAIPVSPNA